MPKYLTQLTQTDRGQSSGRLGFLVTIGLSNAVVWVLVLILTIWKGQFPVIPEGLVYVYAAAQGLAFGGKAAQSFADRAKEPCDDDKGRSGKGKK